jgi:hypothetical protein
MTVKWGGTQWRKDLDAIVRSIFCTLILLTCLYVVFFRQSSTATQVNFASGFIGAIFAYYLAP